MARCTKTSHCTTRIHLQHDTGLLDRCTYNTTGHSTSTRIGATGGDEMCNLYLMFYTLSANDDFLVCADEQNPALSSHLPR